MSEAETDFERHMSIVRYGSYLLTDAIRPSCNLDVVPSAGFRRDVYRDQDTDFEIPVLMVSETREGLFELFIDLLDPLGAEVDVVLETSRDSESERHQDLYREYIDLPILKSILYDFEDLLLNDGSTGIAVLNPRIPMEVQFDEHKLLIMYGHDLQPLEDVLIEHAVSDSETLRFISEGEHFHFSNEEYYEQFEKLKYRLGFDDA